MIAKLWIFDCILQNWLSTDIEVNIDFFDFIYVEDINTFYVIPRTRKK